MLAERRIEGASGADVRAEALCRAIWLCADDYGISASVNRAIRDLIMRERINATSVMVVAPSLHRGEALALQALNAKTQRVAIGLHVTLTAPFRPLSDGFRTRRDGAFDQHRSVQANRHLAIGNRRSTVSYLAELSVAFDSAKAARLTVPR